MKLFEMLGTYSKVGDTTYIKPVLATAMRQPAGARWQGVYPTKEDTDQPDVMRIANKFSEVPVAAAFILPQSPKAGDWDNRRKMFLTQKDVEETAQMKDALKSRNPFHVMAEDDIRAVATKAVEKIMSLKRIDVALRGKWDKTAKAVFVVQQKMKSPDATLVPLASSSNLVYMFAEVAGKKLNIPLIRGFQKRVGILSAYMWDAKQNSFVPNPNATKNNLPQKLDKMLKDINAMYDSKTTSVEQIEAAEEQYNKLVNGALRQSSKHWTHRKNVYGAQHINDEQMLNLEGKDVILVDDNIYRGFTVSDAVMGLARLGIEPKSISVITMHQFYDIRK